MEQFKDIYSGVRVPIFVQLSQAEWDDVCNTAASMLESGESLFHDKKKPKSYDRLTRAQKIMLKDVYLSIQHGVPVEEYLQMSLPNVEWTEPVEWHQDKILA